MPQVSIVLPTYNRADTIGRAISSVQRQSFVDWELIIVDDGSTDGTNESLVELDRRIKYLRQENAGCYVARNRGLEASAGDYITFLDSDDEWLEHFLQLTVGFLVQAPQEQFVMTSFIEDFGNGRTLEHDRHEIENKFPAMARIVGSELLKNPGKMGDPYLRVFDAREELGSWGLEIAKRAGCPDAGLYRGQIFEHLRFGHLGWLPTTVLSRKALDVIGPFAEDYRTAADYLFLGHLYKRYTANMISVPSAIKHETALDGSRLTEAHLATGINEYRYSLKRIPLFDDLFDSSNNVELKRIRGLYWFYVGQVALKQDMRIRAKEHFLQALDHFSALHRARALYIMCVLIPSDRLAGAVFRTFRRLFKRFSRLLG